jgi:hypothetical protein
MANNDPFTNAVADSTSDDLAEERKALEELRASLPAEHGGVKDVAPISVTQVNSPDIEEEKRLLADVRGNVPEIGSKPAPTIDEALKNYGFGNVPSEIYDLAQQETNPEVIHKFPAWFEKTPDQTDYLYEHRKNQSLGDAAQTAVGSAIMGFPSMVASTAKGGIQFLKDVAPEETDPDKLETDLTSQEKLARGLKSLYNPMQDVLEGGWRNLQRAKDHGTFTSDQWKIDHGYLTNEEAKKKFRDRDTFNTHNAQYDAKNPDSVARAIDYTLPLTQKAVRAAIATQSASVDAIMAEHPEWTREQASKFKDDHDELQAQQAIQNAISAQNKTVPTEEEMAFGGIANPLGNEFGWVNMGTHLAKMGAEATGKIIRMGGEEGKFTEGGYVPPKGAENVGEAGKAQKLAEYISDKIQQTGETVDNYLDQIPEPLRSSVKSHLPKAAMGAVPLASGAYGALENPEDRVGGFLKGLTAGSIVMAPRVASDLLKANAKVAGGTGNIFGTAMADPEAALATKLLSYIPSRTIPIVNKNVAQFATDNLKNMVSQGAHLATVATALGLAGDKDAEEVGADIANGILFTGAHGTLNKVLGKDPVQALRDKKRQDFQNYKFLQGLEPTDQSLVKEVTGWNHVVDRSQQNLAQALQDYNQLDPAKTSAEDAKKAADRVVRAKADLADKTNANEATQKAYQRQILSILAEEENKINGPAVPNKTVKFRFMTRDQIADQLMRFNNNMDRTTALHYADNAGARYAASGNVPNAGGQSVAPVIFDPLRDSVVLNIDKLRQTRADTGQTMAHVLRHEVAESALHTRQGQDLFQPLRDSLFGKQIMQPDGSYVTDGKGAYTPEMLNEKYLNNYLRQKKTEAEKIQWSKNNGLWDYKNNDYNKPAIARYMQSEILAEANAAGMNDASTRLDSPLDNLRTWAIVNNENSRLARVIQPLVGRGASNPFKSDLTGVTYTPEHFAQVRNANIQLQRLNGALDATESAPASKVKPKDMMSNRALAEGLGKYDGVFQTTKVLEILDDKGNVVHTQPVDPNLFEGEWTHNPENDEKVKVAGYGQTPDIVDKQIIPQGGKVRIASQIVYDTEGKPVARNPNEYKAQQQMRTAAIRQIFDTVDNNVQGAMNRGFAGGYNYRGNITDNQFNALMALPENILSYGEKEKLATMRDLINDPNGGTAMGLYSARLNARGKYVPFTPKVVEGRPFGMQFSKDGHFLSTEFNVTGARDKVRFIAKHQPDILKLWGNDPNKFMEGLAQYMRNWETNPKVDGRDIDPLSEQAAQIRHRNLDDNFDTAMQKRYIYDAFMNTKPPQGEARPANYNPVTIQLPKVSQKNLTKEEKDDAKRSDPNTLIRTRRIDSYHNILRSNGEKYPFSYGHSIFNATPDAQVPFADEPLPENAAPVEGEQAPAVDPRIAAATQAITPTVTTSFGAAFPATEQPQNMGSPMAQGQGGTERITDATYTDPRTGVVSRGSSHLEANPNAPQEATDRESLAYGFATDSGRIVDRNEAFNIAQNAGQLMSPSTEEEKFHFNRGVLHSGMFTPAGGEGAAGLRFSPAAKESQEPMENREPIVQAAIPEEVDNSATLENAFNLAGSQKWQKGRDLKVAMQQRVKEAAEKAGVDVSTPSPQTTEYLTRVGKKDALLALRQNANAIGWYDIKTRLALKYMSLMHPEILTDENARAAFTWALATTSNGLKVGKNFQLAELAYRKYKETGMMPTDIGVGTAGESIDKTMGLFNTLKQEWGMDNLRQFLLTDFTVGDIGKINQDIKPGGEHADTVVKGAAILGPKIGNGFFSNLYGNFDALTMDRWLVRTWGRWSGTLIEANPEKVAAQSERLQRSVEALSPEQKQQMSGLVKLDVENSAPEKLAMAIQKASMDPKIREQLDNEFRVSGNRLAKYLDGQKEAPAGPHERTYIRSVFSQILDELHQMPEYKDLTMADLQAVLWYGEKRLYETAKTKVDDENDPEGYSDEEAPDYANAAAQVALDNGITQAQLDKATKEEQNNGLSTGTQSINQTPNQPNGQQRNLGGFDKAQKKSFVQTRAVASARSNKSGDERESYSYTGGSGGDGKRTRVLKSLGVKFDREWKAGTALKRIFKNNQIDVPRFLELTPEHEPNFDKFIQLLNESKDSSRFGSSVYQYPKEDYRNMRVMLADDGLSGFAIKPDGDIVSVFSHSKSNSGRSIMEAAIAAGGKKLDCFDTILPSFYASHGFVPTSRLKWDDSQAPEGWDKETYKKYNNGEPDVVFMAYDPSYHGGYSKKDGKVFNTYDEALNAQTKMVSKLAKSKKSEKN